MNSEDAASLLPLHRAGRVPDRRLQKALRQVENDPLLAAEFAAQEIFDGQIGAVLNSISPPENLRQKLRAGAGAGDAAPKSKLRAQVFNPAVLTAVLGVLVIAGFVVWTIMERLERFGGREAVEHMLAATGRMSGVELDPISAPAGKLGDWFYMHGFEGYHVPAELGAISAVGSRVFVQDGHAVAQLAMDRSNSIVNVFRASDFGVDLASDQAWRVLQQDDWVGALRRHDDLCWLVAFRGEKADMNEFLKTLKLPR